MAFDFDNDGVADRLAASVSFSQDQDVCSVVQVYSGAFSQFRFALIGAEPNDFFGYGLSSAGDVNGDGIEDIVIGAPRNNAGGADAGAIYVFSGVDGSLLYTVNGLAGQFFGTAVAGVGDINCDSVPDLLVTGFDTTDLFSVTGIVWALSGDDGSPIRLFVPDRPDESFGHSLLGLGDLSGNGFDDVMIVAPYAKNPDGIEGKAYILEGAASGPAAETVYSGAATSLISNSDPDVAVFGHIVTLGKDIDGDGKREIIFASRPADSSADLYYLAAVDTVTKNTLVSNPSFQMIHPGDATGDQQTDLDDLNLTITNYGGSTEIQTIFDGDLNGDGAVDADDLNPVLDAFGTKSELQELAGSIGVTIAQLGRYSIGIEEDGALAYQSAAHPDPLTFHSLPGLPLGFACTKTRLPGRPLVDGGNGDACLGVSGPITPNPDPQLPNGDRDHDGIPNRYDCDEPEYEGDPLVDCACQDDDNDGNKNQDDCDSECFRQVLDLDVDSDNNNGFDLPDRSDVEDDIEAEDGSAVHPSKLILVQTGDFDDDGVPDFADGMDIHNNDGQDSCYPFTPIVLAIAHVPTGDCGNDIRVRLTYSASDPSAIVREFDEFGDPTYIPSTGALRLWAKSSSSSRRVSSVTSGGDYVPTDEDIPVDRFVGGQPITLFVEAISPSATISDRSISAQLIVNGNPVGSSDTIRLTCVPRVMLGFRNLSVVDLHGIAFAPLYLGGSSAVGELYAGTLSLNNTQLSFGSDGPHPLANDSPLSDRETMGLHFVVGSSGVLASDQILPVIMTDHEPDAKYWNIDLLYMSLDNEGNSESDPDYPDWNDESPTDLDPDGFDAQFELHLLDKYENAEPSIEWLEQEALELRGCTYGGRSWELFSARHVWRDGNSIYVEDSLSPEQAADDYYAYLLDVYGPDAGGVTIIPIIRHYGEIYNLTNAGSRAQVGEYMARHWGLVDSLASDLTTEYYTVGTGFLVDSVLDLRRAKQIRFTPERSYKIPLVRRNHIRGNYVEFDTLVTSLGRPRYNGGTLTVDVPNLGAVRFKPDGLYANSVCEIKDVISLSRIKQLRGQSHYAAQNGLKYVLVCTSRTKRISGPLLRLVREHQNAVLLRRVVNADKFQIFQFASGGPPYSGQWVDVSKSQVQSFLNGQ